MRYMLSRPQDLAKRRPGTQPVRSKPWCLLSDFAWRHRVGRYRAHWSEYRPNFLSLKPIGEGSRKDFQWPSFACCYGRRCSIMLHLMLLVFTECIAPDDTSPCKTTQRTPAFQLHISDRGYELYTGSPYSDCQLWCEPAWFDRFTMQEGRTGSSLS